MRAVIQRVKKASVTVNENITGEIEKGLLVLLGIEMADEEADADWLMQKIVNMRIFSDEDGKMNLSLNDVKGGLLVVSQFTLHASTKKGNRPSFIKAAKPDFAIPLYNYFVKKANTLITNQIQTGEFGAAMAVDLLNDGPVTIIIDSKNKE